jgi:nucleotide-binding universal stress UspA family protein
VPASVPILVGVDGSLGSHAAIRWAAAEAVLRGAPLCLVHGIAVPMDFGAYRHFGRTVLAAARTVARQNVPVGEQVDVSTYLSEEPAVHVLVEWSRQADLVIVGSRGLV